MTTDTSIYEYAKQGLALSANKTAIWFYGKSITYRELFEKIDNVADNLYALGVREGTVVTIHLPNCPQAVMAIYAVAKLGGICNMVHALMPRLGLADNMKFTESEFLITYKPDCLGLVKSELFVDISYHMGIVYKTGFRLKNKEKRPKDTKRFEELEKPSEVKAVIPDQESLAGECGLYLNSSGTTGEPKTIMLSHSSINNCSCDTNDLFEFGEMADQISLGVLPLFHGYGFTIDMHRNIPCGSTLVMMVRWKAKQAVKLIKKYRITVLVGVPAMYSALLNENTFSGKKIRQLSKCCIGGDTISQNLVESFNKRVGNDVMLPGYGLTEATNVICVNTYCHHKADTIGYPLKNTELAVIDEQNRVLNSGKGELIVSGKSLMIGYLKDDAATSNVFLEHNNKKWVQTGDYVEIDADGFVHFISRKKDMIVHNGYNIYPIEVERVIKELDYVSEVCVFGKTSENGTQTVCAAVVLKNDIGGRIEQEIFDCCSKTLPKYSVPQKVLILDELPKNNMGKIDRRKLEAMI